MDHRFEWVRAKQDGKAYLCAVCKCGARIAYGWSQEKNEPINRPGVKPYYRLSHATEVQEAIDAGIEGEALWPIEAEFGGLHSWKWVPGATIPTIERTIEIEI